MDRSYLQRELTTEEPIYFDSLTMNSGNSARQPLSQNIMGSSATSAHSRYLTNACPAPYTRSKVEWSHINSSPSPKTEWSTPRTKMSNPQAYYPFKKTHQFQSVIEPARDPNYSSQHRMQPQQFHSFDSSQYASAHMGEGSTRLRSESLDHINGSGPVTRAAPSGMVVSMTTRTEVPRLTSPPSLSQGVTCSGGSVEASNSDPQLDKIKKSFEQKEAFLKRPLPKIENYPKVLYAQPQKVEYDWPPKQPGASVIKKVLSSSEPDGNKYMHCPQQDPESENVCSKEQLSGSNSISSPIMEITGKSVMTPIGSSKPHCDPPPGWKPNVREVNQGEEEDEDLEPLPGDNQRLRGMTVQLFSNVQGVG